MILSNFPTKTITPESIGAIPNPTGGTAGQVLTKTADGSAWDDAPSGLPDGGTEGQMLYKSADGAAWGDKPVMVVNVTDDETGAFSADKTVDEIKEAYLNGLNVYVLFDNIVFPLAVAIGAETGAPRFFFYAYLSSNSGETLTKLDNISIEIYKAGAADKVGLRSISGGLIPMNEGNQGEILYLANDDTAHWGPAPKGIPDGGTTGQVLTKTSTGEEWSDAPSGLPEGGTEGQVLKRGASGAEWDDAEWLPLSGGTVNGKTEFNDDITIQGYTSVRLVSAAVYSPASVEFENYDNEAEDVNLKFSKDDFGSFLYVGRKVHPAGGPLSSYKGRLGGLDSPKADTDATNKQYVDTRLSTKLTTPTGTQGQLLGFTADNTVGAVDAPESGLTQEQADERYLQLTGGEASNQPFNLTNTIGTRSTTFNLVGEIGANLYFNGLGGPVTGITFNNAGIEFTGGQGRISYLSSPENDEDAANKAYVDQAVANIGGGIVVQATAPENTSLGWIDTSVGGVMKYYDPETSTWKGIIGVWG